MVLRFVLTAGQCHDVPQGVALIDGFCCDYVIGDGGYDSDAFIAAIEARNAVAVIPPRKNRVVQRCYDAELYKTRNLIERFIGHLKPYRRVFSRYDKLAVRYLGFAYFAAVLIQCRQNVNTTA
jgi:transposase